MRTNIEFRILNFFSFTYVEGRFVAKLPLLLSIFFSDEGADVPKISSSGPGQFLIIAANPVLQTKLIFAAPGDTIYLPEGKIDINRSLSWWS